MQEQQPKPNPSRPKLKLLGHDGNIFSILGDASRLLRCAGMSEQANEMADRVHKSGNYYEALGIISEYVETELSDHREQRRTPRKEVAKKRGYLPMSSSIDRSTSREIWEISKRKDDAYGKYPET